MRTTMTLGLTLCCVLASAADKQLDPPIGEKLMMLEGRRNASIEFRDTSGTLRPAIFTAAYEGVGSLTFESGGGISCSGTLAATHLSLMDGDNSQRVTGELVGEETYQNKRGEQRTRRVMPQVRFVIERFSGLQEKAGDKGERYWQGTAHGKLVLGEQTTAIAGSVRVSLEEMRKRKGQVEQANLHITYETTGAQLGLKRDADVAVKLDIYCNAENKSVGKKRKKKKKK